MFYEHFGHFEDDSYDVCDGRSLVRGQRVESNHNSGTIII